MKKFLSIITAFIILISSGCADNESAQTTENLPDEENKLHSLISYNSSYMGSKYAFTDEGFYEIL